MSSTEDASIDNSTARTKFGDRLFIAAYAVAVVVSTAGWFIALGLAAVQITERL